MKNRFNYSPLFSLSFSILATLLLFGFISCKDDSSNESTKPGSNAKSTITETLTLEHIANNNIIDDDGKKQIIVYLPPSYHTTESKYPVIYYFHGYSSPPTEIHNYIQPIHNTMRNDEITEAIIVSVEARNQYNGTFLANSQIIGNWEDAFIKEIVPHIDATYRTINSKNGRGIMGFSMGGYIAVNISFKYPNMFDAIYAISPGLLIDSELNDALRFWDSEFNCSYGMAFAPDLDNEPYYKVPSLDGTIEDQKIIDCWLSGYGRLENKINEYLDNENKLGSIGLEAAPNDYYTWIFNGTVKFSEILNANNIENTLEITNLGHSINSTTFSSRAVPFLTKGLSKPQ